MDEALQEYIDDIGPEHRPLFDRLHHLVLEAHPDACMVFSYKMPTYEVGGFRLYVGVWKHGLSLYGWEQDRNAGFTTRHPELVTNKGTIRLRLADAAALQDQEVRDLVGAALGG
ncbi:MAG: DUF1801 domain-containing protein [Actinomycetota bacterium]|nr:DUF1801 domain-containing protein [Actinomycetota bacterium]